MLRVQYFVFEQLCLFVCSELACMRAQNSEEAPLAAPASLLSVYSGFVVCVFALSCTNMLVA